MEQVRCKDDDEKAVLDHFVDEDKVTLGQKKSKLSEIRTKSKDLDKEDYFEYFVRNKW